MLKYRIPEIFLGALLAVAIFVLGATFWSSQNPGLATHNSGSDRTRNENSKGNQPEPGWITADNLLALFTLGLVIVAGIQLRFFYVQLRLIRESLDDAKQAADSTTSAAAAATRQAKVAEDSLTKLERPYLYVFNISGLETEEYIDDTGPTGELLLSVTYSVANYGKLPAIIKYTQAILSPSGDDPPLPDRLHDGHSLVASPIFAAEERRDGIAQRHIWNGEQGSDEFGEIIPTLKNGESLFLWVILTYRGPFTDQHETRALWIYNESTGRFIPHGGSEHTGQK